TMATRHVPFHSARPAIISRVVIVQLKNKSHIALYKSGYYLKSGKCLFPGNKTIAPGDRDRTIFAKKSYTASGSVGAMIYELDNDLSSRLVILFSNPFSYLLHDRFFAMHITRNRANAKQFYNGMYYHGGILESYVRAQKDIIHTSFTLERDGIRVTGSMSQEPRSVLRVTVEDLQAQSKGTGAERDMAPKS
ncbi:hypothetical protein NDU88_012847, partial [Pleurodeles waltl]